MTEILISSGVTVLCSGGISIFLISLSRRISRLEDKISDMPKEYVLKADCKEDHRLVERDYGRLDNKLSKAWKEIDNLNQRAAFQNGKAS